MHSGTMLIWLQADASGNILFQHVYSHCGVEHNELADKGAAIAMRTATYEQQHEVPIPMASLTTCIRQRLSAAYDQTLCDLVPPPHRSLVCNFAPTVPTNLPRNDRTLMARLRSGTCLDFGPLHARMKKTDGHCRWCKAEVETVAHLFGECRDRSCGGITGSSVLRFWRTGIGKTIPQ